MLTDNIFFTAITIFLKIGDFQNFINIIHQVLLIWGWRLNHRTFNRVAPIDGLGVGHLCTYNCGLPLRLECGPHRIQISGFGFRGPARLVLAKYFCVCGHGNLIARMVPRGRCSRVNLESGGKQRTFDAWPKAMHWWEGSSSAIIGHHGATFSQ